MVTGQLLLLNHKYSYDHSIIHYSDQLYFTSFPLWGYHMSHSLCNKRTAIIWIQINPNNSTYCKPQSVFRQRLTSSGLREGSWVRVFSSCNFPFQRSLIRLIFISHDSRWMMTTWKCQIINSTFKPYIAESKMPKDIS